MSTTSDSAVTPPTPDETSRDIKKSYSRNKSHNSANAHPHNSNTTFTLPPLHIHPHSQSSFQLPSSSKLHYNNSHKSKKSAMATSVAALVNDEYYTIDSPRRSTRLKQTHSSHSKSGTVSMPLSSSSSSSSSSVSPPLKTENSISNHSKKRIHRGTKRKKPDSSAMMNTDEKLKKVRSNHHKTMLKTLDNQILPWHWLHEKDGDPFGIQIPASKRTEYLTTCPNCHRKLACKILAKHLEVCLGKKTGRRRRGNRVTSYAEPDNLDLDQLEAMHETQQSQKKRTRSSANNRRKS